MTSITQTAQKPIAAPGLRPFRTIANIFRTVGMAIAAAHEMESLFHLDDDALARRGLKREDVPLYIKRKYFD